MKRHQSRMPNINQQSDSEKVIDIMKKNAAEIVKTFVQIIGVAITIALAVWKVGQYFATLTAEIKSLNTSIIELKTDHVDLSKKQQDDHDRIVRIETKLEGRSQ